MSYLSFKGGDRVIIDGQSTIYTVANGPDSDGDYKLIYGNGNIKEGYYKKGELSRYEEALNTMELGGFPVSYTFDSSRVKINYRQYSYETTYFGNIADFLKVNEHIISAFFASKVDTEIDIIMKKFTQNFDVTVKELKALILPHTKDLLLTNVIESFKTNTSKIAELFEDKSVKNTLLKLLKI